MPAEASIPLYCFVKPYCLWVSLITGVSMIHYKNNPGVTTVYKVSNNPERVGVGGCLQRKFRGH